MNEMSTVADEPKSVSKACVRAWFASKSPGSILLPLDEDPRTLSAAPDPQNEPVAMRY